MAGVRRSARTLGKSDPIDALAVARAALREPELPVACLDGVERQVRLLVDHREDLVAERTRAQQRLRWHLHELEPGWAIPAVLVQALERHGVPEELLTDNGKVFTGRFSRPPAPQPAPGAAPRPTGGGAPDASVVGPAVQVCRRVQTNGTIRLGARWLSVGRRLAGTEVEVRVSASLLQVAQDGLLLKTMPIPPGVDPARLLDVRPADPGPPGRLGPVQVTRQVHKVGTVTVAGQKFRMGTAWAGQLLTVRVDAELFHVFHDGVLLKTVPRTTRNDVVRFGPTRPPRPRRRAGGGKHQPEPSGPASTEN